MHRVNLYRSKVYYTEKINNILGLWADFYYACFNLDICVCAYIMNGEHVHTIFDNQLIIGT